jgi:hypothetical protein
MHAAYSSPKQYRILHNFSFYLKIHTVCGASISGIACLEHGEAVFLPPDRLTTGERVLKRHVTIQPAQSNTSYALDVLRHYTSQNITISYRPTFCYVHVPCPC